MTEKPRVFEETYKYYLEEIAKADLAALADILGGEFHDGGLDIILLNKPYTISKNGITDLSGKRPPFPVCVVLFKYILSCPERLPGQTEWSSFRDFKDAGPLVVYFASDVEGGIARHFSQKIPQLEKASQMLGGKAPDMALSYDFSAQFQALPRARILLVFNEKDDILPAKCSVLFENRIESLLDMESVAILGNIFAGTLKQMSSEI